MLNRRRFLTHSCSLGAALPTLGSGLLSLAAMRDAAAQQADYKALVCILLAGGNDSYTMLVPTDTDQYQQYANIRSDLALPINDLLPLTLDGTDGRQFGLHPGMTALKTLLDSGDASLIANVGTLLEPFDPVAVNEGRSELPVGLFSHADQIQQWQTAVSDNRTAIGWAGRIADRLQSANPSNGVSMNISLSGSNVFQSGNNSTEYSISANGNGAVAINEYNNPDFFGTNRRTALDRILATPANNLIEEEYRRRFRAAIDQQLIFSDAIAQAPLLTTTFDAANPLSAALAQIGRVASVNASLNAPRQTFFVTVGGWDHHDEVINNQARMLPMVANALADFRSILGELDLFNSVTTFTISDFARTLTSNGRGSDHGWGGHHIVMGGDVNGGQLFGEYPLLSPNSPLDVGRGSYAPTTAVDNYFAELALWFGVNRGDLDQVLPNVTRFFDPTSNDTPLGFMSS